MRNSQIEVRPIAGSIGAEIHNVDVGEDLDEATIGDIRKALLDHCVIFFRDQKLDAERHKAFTRRFGKIFIHPNYKGMQADPEIIMITREPGDKKIVGEDWHADTTMMPEPPMGAILYAIEVPPYGGDTLFANQYQAYEALSEGMKRMLVGRSGRCTRTARWRGRRPTGMPPLHQGARGRRLARDGERAPGGGDAPRDRAASCSTSTAPTPWASRA